jgi:hypothetical protein
LDGLPRGECRLRWAGVGKLPPPTQEVDLVEEVLPRDVPGEVAEVRFVVALELGLGEQALHHRLDELIDPSLESDRQPVDPIVKLGFRSHRSSIIRNPGVVCGKSSRHPMSVPDSGRSTGSLAAIGGAHARLRGYSG